MSCANLHRIMFIQKVPLSPKQQTARLSPIQDRVQKTFLPSEIEKKQGQDFNSQQFYKDVHGREKALVYDHQTIFAKYRKEFTEIHALEHEQRKDFDNQNLYDQFQERIDNETALLKRKIKEDFEKFLTCRLGPERQHLIPEITYRFSQKAFTTFIGEVNAHTTNKYRGVMMDGQSSEHCTLHIPPRGPVQIEATTEALYQNFLLLDDMEKQPRSISLQGSAIYTIGLDGKTQANITFSLPKLQEASSPLIEKMRSLYTAFRKLW